MRGSFTASTGDLAAHQLLTPEENKLQLDGCRAVFRICGIAGAGLRFEPRVFSAILQTTPVAALSCMSSVMSEHCVEPFVELTKGRSGPFLP